MLINKLIPVLSKLNSDIHNAFMPSRLIAHNVIVAFET